MTDTVNEVKDTASQMMSDLGNEDEKQCFLCSISYPYMTPITKTSACM